MKFKHDNIAGKYFIMYLILKIYIYTTCDIQKINKYLEKKTYKLSDRKLKVKHAFIQWKLKNKQLNNNCVNDNNLNINNEELLSQINSYESALSLSTTQVIEETTSKEIFYNYIPIASIKHKAYINDIIFNENEIIPHYLREMNVICPHCGAKHFNSELNQLNKFSTCCHNGKILLSDNEKYPDSLLDIFDGDNEESAFYRNNLREYNNPFAFASFGAKFDKVKGKGPVVYRICGQVYHNVYSLHSNENEASKYGQLYIIDNELSKKIRCNQNDRFELSSKIIESIDYTLSIINPYYKAFKMMKDLEATEIRKRERLGVDSTEIKLFLTRNPSNVVNDNNIVKACNEVAAVYTVDDDDNILPNDVCIYSKNSKPVSLAPINENIDPMVYPLIFPYGEKGWHINMFSKNCNHTRPVTTLQYYSYRFQDRGKFNPCVNSKKLTQQLVVDGFTKLEKCRLGYIRQNQANLRTELYQGLMDYLHDKCEGDRQKIGKMVILPSSFNTGPRAMKEKMLDALAMMQYYGKSDLFVTMTCNPNWEEIQNNLRPNETPMDRPDLVAKVFHEKVKFLKIEIIDNQLFGCVVAYVYVIEFQKRGLPHIHLLIYLIDAHKIRNAIQVNGIISAEIPDKNLFPNLYQLVKQHMIHGPCNEKNKNSPCMENNKCIKKFPKEFCEETNYNDNNGYPKYRRRFNGRQIIYNPKSKNPKVADNRYVVPYNPYLLLKFQCHVNVEICCTIKSIKYLFKYIMKGSDKTMIGLSNNNSLVSNDNLMENTNNDTNDICYDEINQYLSTRYLCPPEAMYRLYEYKLNEMSHCIYRLAVHLENEQQVYFNEENIASLNTKKFETTLTAWFNLNKHDVNARNYLYTEIPFHYVFHKDSKQWCVRKKLKKSVIPRMYFVNPKDIERYYLRMLLLHVKGATSFVDLRTVNGIIYDSYLETARVLNIISPDDEWDKCLAEAVQYKFPHALCELFAYILVFHLPINAQDLYEKYKEHFFLPCLDPKVAEERAKEITNSILITHWLSLEQFGIKTDFCNTSENTSQDQLLDENSFITMVNNLSMEQKYVFEYLNSIMFHNVRNKLVFIDGPGGTGKSYVLNTFIKNLKKNGKKFVCVAWTGIAANLLPNGETAHICFKLPLVITHESVCNIKANSAYADYLRSVDVIIWVKMSMVPKDAFECVDRCLKDICNTNKSFGGKYVILVGDFRQRLPIVKHGTRSDIIKACVKSSKLWPKFKQLKLTKNLRLLDANKVFENLCMNVGNGIYETEFEENNNLIPIPQNNISNSNLINEIFGETINCYDPKFSNSIILALTNEDVIGINAEILNKLYGEKRIFFSVDTIDVNDCSGNSEFIPIEFLNSLIPNGLPLLKLELKVGAIVILLRNLNVKNCVMEHVYK